VPLRVVISDSSCLIDLRKASLLDAFLRLPYELLIPNTLFEDELLKFTAAQKKALVRGGLKVVDLPGDSVLRARQLVRDLPHLSIHDGFAFALAESYRGCILLTGDGVLRDLADKRDIEAHGVLWVIDEIHRHAISTAENLLAALRVLAADPAVRLPHRELAAYIKRYGSVRSLSHVKSDKLLDVEFHHQARHELPNSMGPRGRNRMTTVKAVTLTATDSLWPASLSARLGASAPVVLQTIGPAALLKARKTALFCSARTPGDAILHAYDAARRMAEMLKRWRVRFISGDHAS